MAKISDLSEELLVKIVSFLPTRVAVSTSILSKQWKFLWMWCPDLEFNCNRGSVRDFINKNLPLHRASIIKSLRLSFDNESYQADDSKKWVEIAVSHGLQELSIQRFSYYTEKPTVFLPSSLYTCNSLVTLDLDGKMVLVDVPQSVCLPSLKKLHLSGVTYSDEDSLRLLLCCCPVLEELSIEREEYDNLRALVIKIPSLKRLSLYIDQQCSDDDGCDCEIVTPSLKYFKLDDARYLLSYSIEHMPELEEANISVRMYSYLEDYFQSISTVKRLSLDVIVDSKNETVYGDGIVFSNLENLKLNIFRPNWSKLTFHLLNDSPNLQVLDLVDNEDSSDDEAFSDEDDDEPVGWISNQSLVPECLLNSLKTFKFNGSTKKKEWSAEEEEEKDFICFIIKHARCLESSSILNRRQWKLEK